MDKELTIIAEPEELIAWADTFDILLNPSIEDAGLCRTFPAIISGNFLATAGAGSNGKEPGI